jgi:hypothetical protein
LCGFLLNPQSQVRIVNVRGSVYNTLRRRERMRTLRMRNAP